MASLDRVAAIIPSINIGSSASTFELLTRFIDGQTFV
jgi:hypothetical protein